MLRAHEEPKVGRNLLVAAAPGVQLVAGGADQRGELLFDEVVDVFGFRIVQEFGVDLSATADFRESSQDFGEFFGGEHAGMFERVGVGAAGGEFEGQQSLIVGKRPLPFFKFGIKRLPEAAGPHLHWRPRGQSAVICRTRGLRLFASVQITDSRAYFENSCNVVAFARPCCVWARQREGNPRMRMKPSASF